LEATQLISNFWTRYHQTVKFQTATIQEDFRIYRRHFELQRAAAKKLSAV